MTPLPSRIKVAKSLSVNASLITTPPFFIGDFRAVTLSASTSSNNAINVQLSNAEGFREAIPEASWINVLAVSTNSVFSIPQVGARWSRTSSPASSNCTLIWTGLPG